MARLGKLRDLAARAGRWLGVPAPAAQTAAVVGDRFDAMSWRETRANARALRELIEDLHERYDYAEDLVRDVWTAAVKAAPELRERAEMDAGRLVNYEVVSALVQSGPFAELRRETVGDPYAAAMAVLAIGATLRKLLEGTRDAQAAAAAAAAALGHEAEAAAAVAAAIEAAAQQADDDGGVPDAVGDAAADALAEADAAGSAAGDAMAAAEAAVRAAGSAIRMAVRAGAREAGEAVAEEAALISGWGVEPGELQRMPFEERQRLAERLRQSRLARFTQLFGRFRLLARGERARKVERVAGDVVGVEMGTDLTRLLSSELAQLAVPALRAVWLARWAEEQLLQFETRGEERVGQGAIVVCVDCSGSMCAIQADGRSAEAWAKGTALALLDQAGTERRAFVGILFSSREQVRVFHFPAGQRRTIADVLDFGEFFWGGGTDFEAPLSAAVEVLADEFNADGRAKGDIVWITDGECGVSEEWTADWLAKKRQLDFRLFGIAIGRNPGPVMEALSDNVRTISELVEPDGARDLFRMI